MIPVGSAATLQQWTKYSRTGNTYLLQLTITRIPHILNRNFSIFTFRQQLVEHLTKFTEDTTNRIWSAATTESAMKLKTFLTNKNVVALIAFNIDIQKIFLVASKEFQKRHGTIIGQLSMRHWMEEELQHYKTRAGGSTITNLIMNSYCFTTKGQATAHLRGTSTIQNPKICTSLEDFEKKHVVYAGRYLETNDADYEVTENKQKVSKKFGKLSAIKNAYLDNIIGTNPMSRDSCIHVVTAILNYFLFKC